MQKILRKRKIRTSFKSRIKVGTVNRIYYIFPTGHKHKLTNRSNRSRLRGKKCVPINPIRSTRRGIFT